MSLLGSLITQVAQSALQGQSQQQPRNSGMGGLGGMLGGQTQAQPRSGVDLSNGFGLDDVIGMAGMVMNGNQQQSPRQSQGGALGQILGSVLGGQGGGKNAMMVALLPLALSFIQQNGGLSGALSKIQNMGFGNQAQSWMSANQPNQTLNPNDINQLFDPQQIAQVASQTGCDQGEVCQGMADLLPQVFDQLTPNGNTHTETQANHEINEILSQLSQFIR
ncbi:YidB family protein [Faucicola boevrei]|uniref:YidB family protein n=1 Tax=Faucicola boevrei TaxID=346665 RepID=UPI000378F06C|nr:YidB family protein [Moraxella boevrei]